MNRFDEMYYEYQQREDRKSNAALMIGWGSAMAVVIGVVSVAWGWVI